MPVAVLHAAELVTLAGPKAPRVREQMRDLAIIPDGGMLIEDGRVVATGPSSEIANSAPAGAEIIDASGKMILPGFVDAHTHPVFAGDRIDEFQGAPEQYVALVIHKMLRRVVEEQLAENCDLFCERGYFDITDSEKILRAARDQGLRLRMHVDQLTNSGGGFLAARLKAATADHLEQANAAEIAALAEAGVQPVLLPGSVYSLGKTRYPPAREMIEAGLAVVLATDFNPGSSPTPSIPMVLSLAATQMKMTPAEAVIAATINAAYSLGRGDKIGSLEVGKAANFTLFDYADYREIAYWFGIPQVA